MSAVINTTRLVASYGTHLFLSSTLIGGGPDRSLVVAYELVDAHYNLIPGSRIIAIRYTEAQFEVRSVSWFSECLHADPAVPWVRASR